MIPPPMHHLFWVGMLLGGACVLLGVLITVAVTR